MRKKKNNKKKNTKQKSKQRFEAGKSIVFYTNSVPFHPGTILKKGLGGSESALIHLARELAGLGHSVRVFCLCDAPGEYDGVVYENADQLPAYLSQGKSDLFVSLRIPQIFMETIPAQRKWLWVEDSFDESHIECLKDPGLVKRIDRIVTVSEWQARTYRDHFKIPEEKFWVSRNGFHAPFFEGPPTQERPPRLVYASTPFRGLDVLLDIFPEIRREVPETELTIFSSMAVYGMSREKDEKIYGDLYRKADQPGVHLMVSVSQDRLARELMQAKILAYPNHFAETSCITAIEAQAAGTPVVTTSLGGLIETVHHGQTGLLIPGDSRSREYQERFVHEIIHLLKDHTAWSRLSRQARFRAFQEYRWEVIAHEWTRAFDRSLADGQKPYAGIREDGGPDSRIPAHQKEIETNPENPETYNRLGLACQESGEAGKALEAFRQAIERDVLYEKAYDNYRKAAQELNIPLIRNDLDIVFYTVGNFTPESMTKGGLGGSESALIAMAQELAQLGRKVMVFNTTQSPSVHEGVEYRNLIDFYLLNRFNRIPVFISSRIPFPFRAGINADRKILWVHDDCQAHYIHDQNLKELPIDTLFTVSRWQAETWAEHFHLPHERFFVTRNGIDLSSFSGLNVQRNPKKLIYTSRPNRGLSILLDLFPRIRAQEPDAELHLFTYTHSESLETDPEMAPCLPKLKQPGVFLRGSVPKEDLYHELASSRLLVYPGIWRETSCIAVLEAQAAGVPVVTTQLAALPESVAGGVLIQGNAFSQEYQDRFVSEVVRLMRDQEAWEELSNTGRAFIENRHSWSRIAEEWNTFLGKESHRPKLSLCMIVKDEEDVLAECLESVRTLVDEMIIVDTGSKDGTVDAAKHYGARVIHHPWNNDFSEARNLSLEHASGEWILVLDADELLSQKDLPTIRELIQDKDLHACFLCQRNYTDNTSLLNWQKNRSHDKEGKSYSGYVDSELIRLFRNSPSIRFRGKVHEQVEHSVREQELKVSRTQIPIHHKGKVRGDTHLRTKGDLYERIGQEKLDQDPNDARALFELAAQKIELKRFDEAIPLLQKVIQVNPDSDEAYLNMGSVYMELGEVNSALAAYKEAKKINTKDPDIEYNLGVAYQRMEDHTQAIQAFEKAMTLQPEHFLAYWSLGFSELMQGKTGKAEEHFKASIRINPQFASPHNDLGVLYSKEQRYDLAVQAFERVLQIEPGNHDAEKNLGKALHRLKKRQKRSAKNSPKAPTLSLCMIVKNEEKTLPDCLDSVKDVVDEIIIVDTGSTDRTVEIARKYTDKIYFHAWENSFSKARNYSIGYAESDWILHLDADEKIIPQEARHIKNFIQNAGPKIGHVYLPIINYNDTGAVTSEFHFVRLYRNGIGIHYQGIVHNQVAVKGDSAHLNVTIHHFGYGLSPVKMAAKFERTVTLLKKQLDEDSGNPFIYHNLCLSYSMARKDEEAIQYGKTSIDLCKKKKIAPSFLLYDYYVVAASYYANNNFDRSKEFCEEALALDPDHLDSHYLLAAVHFQRDEYAPCLQMGTRYLELHQHHITNGVKASSVLGTIGFKFKIEQIMGEVYYNLGELAKGDEILARAAQDSGGSITCLKEIGLFYHSRNLIDLAESYYKKILEHDPEEAETLSAMSDLCTRRGQIQSAGQFSEKAITAEPQGESALFQKGVLLLREETFEQAEEAFEKVLKLNPDHTAAWTNLGLTLDKQGKQKEAEFAYEQALTRKPNAQDALANLSHLHMRMGQEQKAEGFFLKLLELGNNAPDILVSLCIISLHKGDVDRLVTYCGHLLQLLDIPHPQTLENRQHLADLFHNIALRLASHSNHGTAGMAWELAIELDPEAVSYYKEYGKTRINLNEYEKALSLLEQALRLTPNDQEIFVLMAEAYRAAGAEEAAHLCEKQVESVITMDETAPPENRKPAQHPTLSLCMIVKDEEDVLDPCLKSARKTVDEIIIVDTGSTDETVKIAERYRARVIHHPWNNDFSEARNISLDHASGDWILWLDADERLPDSTAEKIKDRVNTVPREVDHLFVTICNRNKEGGIRSEYQVPKLIRNHAGIFFQGEIHEQPITQGKAAPSDLRIDHFGYDLQCKDRRQKAERNDTLIRKQIESEPDNPYYYHNLCITLTNLDRIGEAIQAGERAIELTRKTTPRPQFILQTYYTVATLYFSKEEIEKARELAREILSIYPGHLDAHYLLTLIASIIGPWDECIEMGKQYLTILKERQDHPIIEAFPCETMERAYKITAMIGGACYRIGKTEEGDNYLMQALEACSNDDTFIRSVGEFYEQVGETAKAEVIFKTLTQTGAEGGSNLGRTPKVSLCMIVKNEEEMLARCLESVQGCVDEIVIVDTGSNDRTLAIAREFTDKIWEHPWEGSFAGARNGALSHVTGDWVLQLDADEEMVREDALRLRKVLQGLDKEITHLFVNLINLDRTGKVLSQVNLLRIFRYHGAPVYEGIVHNQIRVEGKGAYSNLTVYHYGYDLEPAQMQEKFERTISLLQKQVDQDPDDPFPHHNLCLSYAQAQIHEKVIEEGERTLALFSKKLPDEKKGASIYLNTCHLLCMAYVSENRLDKAREVCIKALQVDPDHPDALFGLSFICYRSHDYSGCIDYGMRCQKRLEQIEQDPSRLGAVPVNTSGKRPELEITMGYAFNELLQPEKTLQYLIQGLEHSGWSSEHIHKVSLFLKENQSLTSYPLYRKIEKKFKNSQNCLF